MTAAESAAQYVAHQWPVFPVKPRDKEPLTFNGFKDASADAERVAKWWTIWPDANVACVPAQTGHIVIDIDGPEGEAAARALGLLSEPTLTVTTSRGRHLWFQHPGGHIGNAPLAPHLDVRADDGYVLLPPSVHPSGAVYRWHGKITEALPLPDDVKAKLFNGHRPHAAAPIPERIPEGQRNDVLTSLAGSLRRRGASEAAIVAALEVEIGRCVPPLDADELAAIAKSVGRYSPAPVRLETANKAKKGAEQEPYFASFAHPGLSEAALYGVPGEFVRIVGPHTEADPAALLVQFLVAFGNCAGRNTWFSVEADRHYLNLFALLFGVTSKGRKGTSWGHVKNVFTRTGDTWATNCLWSGFSSGEGVIWQVRDPIEKQEPIREKQRIIGYQTAIVDQGVTDKRLLVVEAEFASTLRVMTREGNTVSAVIRQAWDDGMLRTMTKNSPAVATNAHISIIGHVTRDELRRELTQTDAANGFANRFLFVATRRSKTLPEGGNLAPTALEGVVTRVADAVVRAMAAGELRRDDAARTLWASVYPALSAGRPGLLGAATGRAEAQVTRLACLYALLDGSTVIREPHLHAALALWDYCAASAGTVFKDTVGDVIADDIRNALRQNPDGLSRTEISESLQRHRSTEEINRALGILHEGGYAVFETVQTGGRPREVWRALGTREKRTRPRHEPPHGLELDSSSSLPAVWCALDGPEYRRGYDGDANWMALCSLPGR